MCKNKFALFTIILTSILAAAIKPVDAVNLPSQPIFVQEFIGQIDFIEGRLLQLEGAMAQDQMTWSPAEGVRNCAEIYLHVAEANYMLAGYISGKEMKGERGELEKSTTNKDEIAKILKDSFKAVKDAAGNLSQEDLDAIKKTPFGMDMSLRNFMISLLNHSHEHLGQGIAYARSNGVTPPWSKKQDG